MKTGITKKKKKELLLIMLEKSLGVVTSACKNAMISRDTYYTYYHEDAEFAQRCDDIQNIAIDFVESKLFAQIMNGDVASTIFYLKTKAKNRGYSERTEVMHNIEQIMIKPYEPNKEITEG